MRNQIDRSRRGDDRIDVYNGEGDVRLTGNYHQQPGRSGLAENHNHRSGALNGENTTSGREMSRVKAKSRRSKEESKYLGQGKQW